jgi:hypothetical protein
MDPCIRKPADVRELVTTEFNQIANPELKEQLARFLCEPFLQVRTWEYSKNKENLPCWIIAELGKHDLGLAYSEFGHGSSGDHWGIVKLSDSYFGRDDSWFLVLEDAFINSGFYDGPLPGNYEIR